MSPQLKTLPALVPPPACHCAERSDEAIQPPARRRPRALLALALALAAANFSVAQIKVGDAFPALASAGLVGDVPATAGKITVVDFCASWCAPCKASLPVYAKIAADYAARGVVFVAVGIDEEISAHDAFAKKMALTFPLVHDRAQKLVAFVKVPAMPTSYVLARDGSVRYIHSGFHAATEKELRAQLDTLLAEKP